MKKKILIIEDDLTILDLLKEFLSTQGYLVDFATDGLEGVNLFNSNTYDLIILDIMIPKMNGFEVCKYIRSKCNTPIIFLSALSSEENQIQGFDLYCDDYICKPFSFNVLIKRVNALINRTSNKKETILSFESMNLYLNSYKLIFDNKEIELTLTEFNILKCLIENYPRIITREMMIDCVWGYDYYGESRVVDAHIKNIRRKTNIPYIKAVKGIGYVLDKNTK